MRCQLFKSDISAGCVTRLRQESSAGRRMQGATPSAWWGCSFFYGEFMGNYGYFGAFFGVFPLFEVVNYGYFSLFCGISYGFVCRFVKLAYICSAYNLDGDVFTPRGIG